MVVELSVCGDLAILNKVDEVEKRKAVSGDWRVLPGARPLAFCGRLQGSWTAVVRSTREHRLRENLLLAPAR